eukprot:UN03765
MQPSLLNSLLQTQNPYPVNGWCTAYSKLITDEQFVISSCGYERASTSTIYKSLSKANSTTANQNRFYKISEWLS